MEREMDRGTGLAKGLATGLGTTLETGLGTNLVDPSNHRFKRSAV